MSKSEFRWKVQRWELSACPARVSRSLSSLQRTHYMLPWLVFHFFLRHPVSSARLVPHPPHCGLPELSSVPAFGNKCLFNPEKRAPAVSRVVQISSEPFIKAALTKTSYCADFT